VKLVKRESRRKGVCIFFLLLRKKVAINFLFPFCFKAPEMRDKVWSLGMILFLRKINSRKLGLAVWYLFFVLFL